MKKKLEETRTKCSYKNYDIMQAKNDFNFERRDWMEVQPEELPTGSQLIMGLNPPFGVKASLANQFINKALEFKPKLLILIVPPETERLDKKKSPYDLIWEDDELLAGKSFYLPGSVDVNDKQMEQWNVTPPPLYLWSHPDWTAKHKVIAQKNGHLSDQRMKSRLERSCGETQVPDSSLGRYGGYGSVPMPIDAHLIQNVEPEEHEKSTIASEGYKESTPQSNGGSESHENYGRGKNKSRENSKKRWHVNKQHGRGMREISPGARQSDGMPPLSEAYRGMPHHSLPNMTDGRSSLESYLSQSHEMPSHMEVGEDGYRHFQHDISRSDLEFGAGYAVNRGSTPEDTARRYIFNNEQPYSTGTHRWSSNASPAPGPSSLGYGSYATDLDDRYGKNLELRSFGRQDPDSLRRGYFMGSDPGFGHASSLPSYNHLGSAGESSYHAMNMSAMQRYAPRLDELNPTRMSNFGSEPPMVNRNGIHDHRAPPPSYRGDSMGFVPGPHYGFSHQNSSGWLNE